MEENNTIYNFTSNDILSYIGINELNKYNTRNFKLIKKASFQKDLLDEIFNHKTNVNVIEDLELQYLHLARLSLVTIINFINNNNNILLKIEKPIFYNKKNILFLGNKALEQLDVFNKNNCLFNIINNTKTPIGKRLLKECINNPSSDIDLLNERYNLINDILDSNLLEELKDNFNNIYDITKLLRRVVLNKIHPYELYNLYTSVKKSIYIFEYIKNAKLKNKFKIDLKQINELKKIVNFIEENFDLNYIMNINYINYKEETHNYILLNDNLSDIEETIKMSTNFMDYLVKELEKHIDEKKFMNKNKETINLKFNERDGYYLLLTKRRSKILLENLKKLKK